MPPLTPKDAAIEIGCSTEHVLDMLRDGRLSGYTLSKPGSRRPRWRITPEAIASFKSGNRPTAAAKKPAKKQRPKVAFEYYK